MPFRCSFFFQIQQARLAGWSENYWNSHSDLSDVVTRATTLRNALFEAKAFNVYCPNVRISDVANFRAVTILNFTNPAFQTPTTSGEADYATTAGLVKLGADPNYTVRQWYRGLYDADVDNGGYWKPTPAHQALYNVVLGLLTNAGNGWSLRVLDKSQAKKTVNSITVAGVVTCLGHGFVTDDLVRISRVKTPKLANKVWRIVKVDNDTFSLNGFPLQTDAPQIGNTTAAQKQAYTYRAIARATFDRATSHKTGRPFGQLSGRRRTVRT